MNKENIIVNVIHNQNCLSGLKNLPDKSVNTCITSPPYYGLRDYGNDEQIGLEDTPEAFIQKLVEIFREVNRVLRDDGTLWVNIGDSYAGSGKGGQSESKRSANWQPEYGNKGKTYGLKPKDLIGIPWMLAFALRADGWYLRQDIIWHKPNPMPESVTDRCTKSHEYIFLLSKRKTYYYDYESIKTKMVQYEVDRRLREKRNGMDKTYSLAKDGKTGLNDHSDTGAIKSSKRRQELAELGVANKRSVWTVNTQSFAEAHFATFPEELIVDCIKAGCPRDGIVLDPFMGAGTTALVARSHNRNYIGFELNPEYIAIAEKRLTKELGIFQ